MSLQDNLALSYTPYQTVENVIDILSSVKAEQLQEGKNWKIVKNKTYYVVKDGSAIIAFKVGGNSGFSIVAAHTDSPCLKLKHNPCVTTAGCVKFNVEKYGGGINYSYLDIPLVIAGRIIYRADNELFSRSYISPYTVVIPSLAIHFNREANNGLTLNAQTHLQPIVSLDKEFTLQLPSLEGATAVDYDLYLVNASTPFECGANNELLVSPRIDDLACVYAALEGFAMANPGSVAVAYFANNEEVGSSTKQGAGGTFLVNTLKNISKWLDTDYDEMCANSILVSADNAHAVHPNYPEKSDPTNSVLLGGGVVVKYHANQNYTTDAFSSAVIKTLADRAQVATQDFFMRADMPCGGTLGAISSHQVSIISVDIGLPQLAMHSATETMAIADYHKMVKLLTEVFNCTLTSNGYDSIMVE